MSKYKVFWSRGEGSRKLGTSATISHIFSLECSPKMIFYLDQLLKSYTLDKNIYSLKVREHSSITSAGFPKFWTPPPCVSKISTGLGPPLICWCNTWTERRWVAWWLIQHVSNYQICFSIIIRNIFWGLELYSRISSHDLWRNS